MSMWIDRVSQMSFEPGTYLVINILNKKLNGRYYNDM